MKAIPVHEFGGPEVLTREEIADLLPGARQVVVRTEAAGIVEAVRTDVTGFPWATGCTLPIQSVALMPK